MKDTTVSWAAFAGLLLAAVAGCPGEESEGGAEALGAHEAAITSVNRLSMNHLKASSLAMIELSVEPLSSDGLTLAQGYLLKSSSSRRVLDYMVKCALPPEKKLSGSFNGKTYTFSGLIGLAPEWLGAPLSASGRRWVSACMLAHVNGYNDEVHISLRGAHPALAASAAEAGSYAMEEMSFYGDIFAPNEALMYACAGEGPQEACPADPDEYWPQRSCDEDEPCLLQAAGPCHDITLSGADACEGGGVDWSSGCHASSSPNGQGWPAEDPPYLEVITVHLKPYDFWDYYGCGLLGLGILGL